MSNVPMNIPLREAALLQTFPKSYQFLKRVQRVCFSTLGRLIGNAVHVRLGEVVAGSFVGHITEESGSRLPAVR